MKKSYRKPQIIVEDMFLDDPIANSTCTINYRTDPDVKLLKQLGCFVVSENCQFDVLPGGGFDFDGNGEKDPNFHDTICYHSNIDNLFAS